MAEGWTQPRRAGARGIYGAISYSLAVGRAGMSVAGEMIMSKGSKLTKRRPLPKAVRQPKPKQPKFGSKK